MFFKYTIWNSDINNKSSWKNPQRIHLNDIINRTRHATPLQIKFKCPFIKLEEFRLVCIRNYKHLTKLSFHYYFIKVIILKIPTIRRLKTSAIFIVAKSKSLEEEINHALKTKKHKCIRGYTVNNCNISTTIHKLF